MSKKVVDVAWRPVMRWYEHSELVQYSYIKIWQPKDLRHRLFNAIKHSDQQQYKGAWGPEILHWSPSLETGYIHCTESRQQQIQQWISERIAECAPGNE